MLLSGEDGSAAKRGGSGKEIVVRKRRDREGQSQTQGPSMLGSALAHPPCLARQGARSRLDADLSSPSATRTHFVRQVGTARRDRARARLTGRRYRGPSRRPPLARNPGLRSRNRIHSDGKAQDQKAGQCLWQTIVHKKVEGLKGRGQGESKGGMRTRPQTRARMVGIGTDALQEVWEGAAPSLPGTRGVTT